MTPQPYEPYSVEVTFRSGVSISIYQRASTLREAKQLARRTFDESHGAAMVTITGPRAFTISATQRSGAGMRWTD